MFEQHTFEDEALQPTLQIPVFESVSESEVECAELYIVQRQRCDALNTVGEPVAVEQSIAHHKVLHRKLARPLHRS